jgi:hypothetical protein
MLALMWPHLRAIQTSLPTVTILRREVEVNLKQDWLKLFADGSAGHSADGLAGQDA